MEAANLCVLNFGDRAKELGVGDAIEVDHAEVYRTMSDFVATLFGSTSAGESAPTKTSWLPSRKSWSSLLDMVTAPSVLRFQGAAKRPRSRRLLNTQSPVPSQRRTFALRHLARRRGRGRR